MKNMHHLSLSASLLILALGAVAAHADALPVEDPSFETPTVSNGSEGLLEGTNHVTGVPYTESDFFTVGVANPDSEEFAGGTGNDLTDNPLPGAADGKQALEIESFTSEEKATYNAGNLGNFVAGDQYTLTVAIGDGLADATSHQVGGTYSIDLLENGQVVDTASSTAQVGTFTDLSLTFTAGAGDTGAINFDLGLTGDNGTGKTLGYIDNVGLTVQATPEPSSIALSLIAAGFMAVLGFRRARKA
jgi:hypothetical protein